jgi:hypothetical protein
MRVGQPVALFLLLLATSAPAEDSMESERVRKTLHVMDNAATWYHDDLFGEFAGFSYYARKRYADALHYFEIGAYYADKPSQISIGLMYLHGDGVKADVAVALAWLDIAAERGYPAYVATRDRVKATLSSEQQTRAAAAREQLVAKYGDAVAKPRLANELREGRRRMTGSRAGFDSGVTFLQPDAIANPHEAGSMGVEAVAVCPLGFWDPECWEPDRYFAMRDRQLNATVEVGPPQEEHKIAH